MELSKKELRTLNVVLATIYPSQNDARRVASSAGLNVTLIAIGDKPILSWFNIVENAVRSSMIPNLVDFALEEFPDQPILSSIGTKSIPGISTGPEPSEWSSTHSKTQLEKIIGNRSTLVDVNYLEIGIERSKAVGRIVLPDKTIGSGFLVEDDIFITNNHVVSSPEDAVSSIVQFNFQKSISGRDAPVIEYSFKPQKFFRTCGDDDWTAIKVEGSPTTKWGKLEFGAATVVEGEHVNIIQHAGGGYKQVSLASNTVVFVDERRIQYLTDTLPGSSGSPVFNNQWQVVALHHSGGWITEPNSPTKEYFYRNEGTPINIIRSGLI